MRDWDMEKQIIDREDGLIEGNHDNRQPKGWGGTVPRPYIPIGYTGEFVVGGDNGP